MKLITVLVALTASLLTACGSGVVTVTNASPETPIAERLVGCGSTKYPRAALQGPTGAENGDHPAAKVLRDEIRTYEDVELRPTDEWRLLYEMDGRAVFGGGAFEDLVERGLAAEARAEEREGDWRLSGITFGCHPAVDTGDQSLVDWAFASAEPAHANASSLDLLIIDRSCGGRDVLPRLNDPLIEYTDEAIHVLLTAEPLPAGSLHTCEGFPPSPYRLELSEPVGDRSLLDGGTYPATQPGPPEDL